MNGLDYVILALIGLGAILGSGRGVLRIASSLIALVAAVYLAALYYPAAGGYLARAFSMRPETAAVLGYILIFLAVMVIVAWGGAKLATIVRAVHMSWADRLGGAFVGAALGALLAGLIVVIATVTLPAGTQVLTQSQLAPRLQQCTRDLAEFVPGQIRDDYYKREAQLITYWNEHKAASAEPASGPATRP